MYAVAAVVMGGAAVWVALLGPRPTPTPRTAKSARTSDTVDRKSGLVEDARRRGLVCVVGCALVGSVAAGPAGVLVGGVGGVLLTRALGRLETPSVARERLRIQRDLPVAVDLLSACAVAGLPVMAALPTVARALGGPIAQRFDTLHARWGLGASVPEEWERLAADPALHRLGSAMVRAHRSGAPGRRDPGPTRGRRPPRATQPAAGGGAGCRGQGGGADGGLLPARVHAHRRRAHDRRWVPPPRPLTVRPQPAVTRAPVNRLPRHQGPTGRAGFG